MACLWLMMDLCYKYRNTMPWRIKSNRKWRFRQTFHFRMAIPKQFMYQTTGILFRIKLDIPVKRAGEIHKSNNNTDPEEFIIKLQSVS